MRLDKNKFIFSAIFAVIALAALQVPVNGLSGSSVKFTLFDLFAPIAGSFLGLGFGIFSVLTVLIVNVLFHGSAIDKGVLIRLLPTLFGVWFFAKREKNLLIIPAIAIISFNLNPIGRSVWFYSLFWLIPFFAYPLSKKSLIAKSLTTTFIAHSVGGAIWIWVFKLPAAIWVGLIPVVIFERAIFTLGISANYILMNNVLAYLSSIKLLPESLKFEKKYLIKN